MTSFKGSPLVGSEPGGSSFGRRPYYERKTNFKAAPPKFAQRPSKRARTANTLPDLMEELQRAEIAARIRDLRARSPYSQQQVADRLGIGLRAYQKLEKLGTTKWERVQQLAEVFTTAPEKIWYGDEYAPPDPNQLNRIERKLDALLDHFEIGGLEELAADNGQGHGQSPRRTARRRD